MTDIKRKGARTMKDIPSDILEQLNRGEISSANLMEFLGVDRIILLENILTMYNREKYLQPIMEHVNKLEHKAPMPIYKAISTGIYEQIKAHKDDVFLSVISNHPSDIVRCWATHVIGQNTELNIEQMLNKMRPFAADNHFNVREYAWIYMREMISQNLSISLEILSKWAKDDDENIRRFASEATRPRGVWCKHITELKEKPELAMTILEPLKSDKSKYVRDSVGNWLNDASKTQPEFVKELCTRWNRESNTKETAYITKKALRTIEKQR